MSRKHRTKTRLLSLSGLGGATVILSTLLSAMTVSAQIDEIIVTSQKREQSLQDVPISVLVVDGDFLDARNFNEVSELRFVAPGFDLNDANNQNGQGFQVRGIGTQVFGVGTEDSVAVVVDGVVLGRTIGGLADLADVERIEVLRGPQGTLFGKNASAGLLNIVTKGPTEEFVAEAGFGYSELNEIKANAAVSGPLLGSGDKAFFRLSAYHNNRDGLVDNISDGRELNNRNETGVRGKLELRLTDSVTVNIAADYSDSEEDCCVATAVEGGAAIPGITPGITNNRVSIPGNIFSDLAVWGVSAQVDWEVADHTVTSITAYRGYDLQQEQELIPVLTSNLGDGQQDQFTQELRITSPTGGRFEYVAGLYFFKQFVSNNLDQIIDLGMVTSQNLRDTSIDTLNYAAFGDVTFSVTDDFRLLGGLRVLREELDLNFFRPNVFCFCGPGVSTDPVQAAALGLVNIPNDNDDSAISWRAGIQYDILDDAMAYFTVSRGYKGGGFNALDSTIANTLVEPEIPTSYEGGIRSTWFDGRLTANVTGFYTRIRDFQAQAFDNVALAFSIINAGVAETKGAEFEFVGRPFDTTSISLAGAYIDATFDEFVGGPCFPGQTVAQGCIGNVQDLSGADIGNSPDWTITSNLNQQVPLESLPFDGFFNLSYFYRSEANFTTAGDPGLVQDGYHLVDTSLGIEGNDGQYTLTFFVKNVFDENFATSLVNLSSLGGAPVAQFPNYNAERRFGFSVKARY